MTLTNRSKDVQDLSWSKAVFFEPDERLIHEFKLGAKMSLDSGVVVVTNNRILVIQNQGKAIRNYKLLAETHLEHVSGISEEGIMNKKITVKTTESPTGKLWFYMASDTALFQQIVNHQRHIRLQRLQYQASQRNTYTVIQKVEKAPLLKCLWCKHLIPEGAVKCANCGGPASADTSG